MTDIIIQERNRAISLANAASTLEELDAVTERLAVARSELFPSSELNLPVALLEAMVGLIADQQARVATLEAQVSKASGATKATSKAKS